MTFSPDLIFKIENLEMFRNFERAPRIGAEIWDGLEGDIFFFGTEMPPIHDMCLMLDLLLCRLSRAYG